MAEITKLQRQAFQTVQRLIHEASTLLVSAANKDTLRSDGAESLLGSISESGTPANEIWSRISQAETWIENALEG